MTSYKIDRRAFVIAVLFFTMVNIAAADDWPQFLALIAMGSHRRRS